MFKGNRLAFTLAEVLITLGIIGVVASMTIPNLVKNYQKTQTTSQLQKFYSVINQAILRSTVENGIVTDWAWPATPDSTNSQAFCETYLFPYLNVQKKCGYQGWGTGCHSTVAYYLDRTSVFGLTGVTFVLSDGTLVTITLTNAAAARIFVDLNGDSPPNLAGRDAFYLVLMNGKIAFYPGWWNPTSTARATLVGTGDYACNKNATSLSGASCGMLMMKDGWKINNDYPWD